MVTLDGLMVLLESIHFRSSAAAAVTMASVAVIISPFGLSALAGRPDLSVRVNVTSVCLSLFLFLISGGILCRGRARVTFFYLIWLLSPLAAVACLEVAAISVKLSDRIGKLEDLSPLTSGKHYPPYMLSEARYYNRDGLILYRPYNGDGIRINELGLRTASPVPKVPGEWRVAITGGSAGWGWHVLDADTIPEQLQRIVRDHGQTNITVYNFGVEGATLQAELALLKHFASRYLLDEVIFYTGFNDAHSEYYNALGLRVSELSSFELIKAAHRLLRMSIDPAPQTLALMDQALAGSLGAHNRLRARIAAASAHCSSAGLRCHFVMQPMIFDLRTPVGSDQEIMNTVKRIFPRFDVFARKIYAEAFAAAPPEAAHDVRAVFDQSIEPVFLDFAHTSELGYRLVAEQISARVPIGKQ
jgi:lysophospholipase L1-like esterase